MSQQPGESFRDYLERREAELRDECRARRQELFPKERELEEVRKAMAALGMKHGGPLTDAMTGHGASDFAGPLQKFLNPPPLPITNSNAVVGGYFGDRFSQTPQLPYEGLTIKQLIVKALLEGCPPNGATAAELRDFIHRAYGRDIDRASLSPQLSRLRDEGIIGQSTETSTEGALWTLQLRGVIDNAVEQAASKGAPKPRSGLYDKSRAKMEKK